MFVGHFAIGLAIKAHKPKVPALPIMIGVGLLDIISGLLTLAGLDQVTPNLSRGPYMFYDLTYIDWDHSLLMAAVWSLCWGALFLKNRQVAIIAALAVFSHFLADLPLHNHDMALYPGSPLHLGFGLWETLGIHSWILEGLFSAILAAYFWRANAARGVKSHWPCLLLVVLFIQNSPWLSPMQFTATFAEPAAQLALAFLVTTSFLILGFLFSWLISRAELQR